MDTHICISGWQGGYFDEEKTGTNTNSDTCTNTETQLDIPLHRYIQYHKRYCGEWQTSTTAYEDTYENTYTNTITYKTT